ncbi:unnamed protein product [Periconia digitata]|uniref:C2H2-type domain-containing protein n=1 Tax=Periconia digitata TaxID=1303443 RepID=A0A9W4UAB7_9PLEO|nr:unnamed protein product [Periconia digitata]
MPYTRPNDIEKGSNPQTMLLQARQSHISKDAIRHLGSKAGKPQPNSGHRSDLRQPSLSDGARRSKEEQDITLLAHNNVRAVIHELKKEKNRYGYRCIRCLKIFVRYMDVKQHVQLNCDTRRYKCWRCRGTFWDWEMFWGHGPENCGGLIPPFNDNGAHACYHSRVCYTREECKRIHEKNSSTGKDVKHGATSPRDPAYNMKRNSSSRERPSSNISNRLLQSSTTGSIEEKVTYPERPAKQLRSRPDGITPDTQPNQPFDYPPSHQHWPDPSNASPPNTTHQSIPMTSPLAQKYSDPYPLDNEFPSWKDYNFHGNSSGPPRPVSQASSFGSANSGVSHPPREKGKRRHVIDMSYSQFEAEMQHGDGSRHNSGRPWIYREFIESLSLVEGDYGDDSLKTLTDKQREERESRWWEE